MEPPLKPHESDCCNSGCQPCILDVYEQQLKKYLRSRDLNLEKATKINGICATNFTLFKLTERKSLNADTFLFKFVYADSSTPDGVFYNPGQYFMLKAQDNSVTRAYTPIPFEIQSDLGFTTLIKLYDHGKMSNFLRNLKIGDKTQWRGPYGDFQINYEYKHLLFIVQGTGIAPIYSVIKKVIENEDCESFVKLFFCCRSPDDVYLREQLRDFSDFWNFSYELFVGNCFDDFVTKYNEVVHINKKLDSENVNNFIKDKLNGLQIVICGSETFSQTFKESALTLGVKNENIYIF